MGSKDEYLFDYLNDNTRFADQINGAFFHGEQVVKPEELEEAEQEGIYFGKDAGKRKNVKTIVDKVRMWKGQKIHILAVENQNYVDYQMVLRNMLSESIGYHKQWKQKKREHERAKDLKGSRDEFLSGIRRDEKFTPIITLVVCYGEKDAWDGARCLYDLLDIDEQFKKYITNYQLNIYNCHEHDSFDEYRTDLRQLFEMIRYSADKKKLQEVVENNKEDYSRINSDTRELLEVVANIKIPEECKVTECGKERFNMCKAFEDMKLEGMELHTVELIQKKLAKGKKIEVIADELEESTERICELMQQYKLA